MFSSAAAVVALPGRRLGAVGECPQAAARPRQPGPHRALGHAQCPGGLGGVQARPDADQHIALAGGQAADGGPHRRQPVLVVQAAGELVGEVGQAGRRGRQAAHRRPVPAGRASLVAGHVDRDAQQPRPQRPAVRRNVSETTSSAADQFPLSPAAYRYTACACSSKSAANASGSLARTRARRFGSTLEYCPDATTAFSSQPAICFPGHGAWPAPAARATPGSPADVVTVAPRQPLSTQSGSGRLPARSSDSQHASPGNENAGTASREGGVNTT